MKPLVSVILPVYNQANLIYVAIDSILNQSFTEFELIIINDGSTDSTDKIIQSFKDTRIRVYSTENRGISKALNFGIKLSQSDIIARIDADDVSKPDRLTKQYEYLTSNPDVGLVSSKVMYGGDRKVNLGYALYVDQINKLMTHDLMYIKRFQESPIAHPSVMYRKDLIEKYGGYIESDLPEDYELWLRWFSQGILFSKLEDNLLIWNDLPSRISRNNKAYLEDKFIKVKAKYLYHELFNNGQLPSLWIWGTGKKVNASIKPFIQLGFTVEKFIDVKPSNTSSKTIHYKNLPPPGDFVVLSFVKDRIGKMEIEKYLLDHGFKENTDFYLMN